jgi:hypothetical protein
VRSRRREKAAETSANTTRSVVEVAAVKAQVQGIVRRLRSTLDELEAEIGQLPDDPGEGEAKPDDADAAGE